MAEIEQADLTTLTVELLSAFVSNNTIDSGDLAGLIQSTHTALAGINTPPPGEPPAAEYEPAVTVRKSLGSRDHILSLIDGKPYKTLKRHLSGHGLTPSEYRERYKLPSDYPMVAPSYSDHRREVAQRLGLGRKSVKVAASLEKISAKPAGSVAEATAPTAITAKAPRKATSKQVATNATSATKLAKPAAKRAAKAVPPAPVVMDAAPLVDSVEPSSANASIEPKSAENAAAAVKPAAAKAKSAVPAKPKAKPKTPSAARGRAKPDTTPTPTE